MAISLTDAGVAVLPVDGFEPPPAEFSENTSSAADEFKPEISAATMKPQPVPEPTVAVSVCAPALAFGMIEKSRIEYTLDRPKEASCSRFVTELTVSVIVSVGDPEVLITAGVTTRIAFPAVTPERVTEIWPPDHGFALEKDEEADWTIAGTLSHPAGTMSEAGKIIMIRCWRQESPRLIFAIVSGRF